jgi:hypothetical protein
MLVPFDTMPDTARLWVYQGNRELKTEELPEVKARVEAFLSQWKRHGKDLKASYTIRYNQFLVLLVDETVSDVSGCAIDASVSLIKGLEQDLGIDLTDRMLVTFRDGDNINVVPLSQFREFASEGKILGNTLVFNNLITQKSELESDWEVPAQSSWHNRFIPENHG